MGDILKAECTACPMQRVNGESGTEGFSKPSLLSAYIRMGPCSERHSVLHLLQRQPVSRNHIPRR